MAIIDYEKILAVSPYSLNKVEKHDFLSNVLSELTLHHYQHCPDYQKILDAFNFIPKQNISYSELPFLPVRLFKQYELRSIARSEIVKTMTSSGTSGQAVSKIYLDRQTAMMQTKVLTRLINSYLGKSRLPMIILDSESVVKDRTHFSARGAGILGFSMFGRDKVYAFDQDMNLQWDKLQAFLLKHQGEKIFLFGFTYIIWLHFYHKLKASKVDLDLSQGVLVHGGGWKKLVEQQVSPEVFRSSLYEICGLKQIHDYYGMVEQTGTIYFECEHHHLHASIFSDIIVRRANDFSMAETGETGLLQVLSVLPFSYPGHSLLTEDEGVVLGEDDCPCQRMGKYFKVTGRIKNAELRGCSDTYAA